MRNKNLKLSAILGMVVVNGLFATNPSEGDGVLDLNTVIYIEEEIPFELGFDTADYLPEGFDPHEVYFDLLSIPYIEEEPKIKVRSKRHLPKDFDVYAYPKNIEGFNYIDENDNFLLDFDTKKHLPEGFDPYMS